MVISVVKHFGSVLQRGSYGGCSESSGEFKRDFSKADFNEAAPLKSYFDMGILLWVCHTIFGVPVHDNASEGLLRNMLLCKHLLLFYENK